MRLKMPHRLSLVFAEATCNILMMLTDPTRPASELDEAIGARIRELRRMRDLSMQKLAQSLGVTHQQVQKYEQGRNRISASTLYRLSRILDVQIDAFFPDTKGNSDERMLTSLHSHLREPLMNLIRALPSRDVDTRDT